MNARQQGASAWMFSLFIVLAAAFVAQRFFLPLTWSAILGIATWPLYLRVVDACGKRRLLAAIMTVTGVAIVFLIPLLLFAQQAIRQAPALASLLEQTNAQGLPAPGWLAQLPIVGSAVTEWWTSTLAQPQGLAHLIRYGAQGSAHSASDMVHRFGAQLFHRTLDVGLAFVFLFFVYKDGAALARQLALFGERSIGSTRWSLYSNKVPAAIRATVNGLVLVGLAEGVLMGIGYEIAGVKSAALWGAASGVLGIIPFGAPLVFLSASALLYVQGHTSAAVAIACLGVLILFVADHVVRPKMIGSTTQLPFLPVLIGILGGVEVLGLVGLFLGPVAMTLFVTLWHEAPNSQLPAAGTAPPGPPGMG